MRDLLLDLRLAGRSLAQRPVYAVTITATLALALAAAAIVFSLLDHLVLRSVEGVQDPQKVVEIGRSFQGHGFDTLAWSEVRDLGELDVFAAVAGVSEETVSVRRPTLTGDAAEVADGGVQAGDGEVAATRRRSAFLVSPGYFHVMGIQPAAGRFFFAEEGVLTDPRRVAVVSHRFWSREMAADPRAVGRTLRVNRQPFRVVGVAPEGFTGHDAIRRPDLFLPTGALALVDPRLHAALAPDVETRLANWQQAVARLATGTSAATAADATAALFAALAREHPEVYRQKEARVVPLRATPGFARGPATAFLGLLLGLTGVLLAVACANVSGLVLARNADRRRALAVRLALGSGRGRLVRQLLLELCLLFAAGAIFAFGLATAATRALTTWLPTVAPAEMPPLEVAPDLRVFAFALALAVAAALATGALPALRASRTRIVPALKVGVEGGLASVGVGGAAGRSGRLRRAFVSLQVALTLLLLVSAGLLARSLHESGRAELAIEPAGVATASLDLASEGYDEAAGRELGRRLLERAAALPGVAAVALAQDLPLDLSSHGTAAYLEGDAEGRSLGIENNAVTAGYFDALGLPLVAGRGFRATDDPAAPPVALVSRAFVRAAFPGEAPSHALGRRFRFGDPDAPWTTVVGVVEDVANQTFSEQVDPMVYRPWEQGYSPAVHLVVKARGGGTGPDHNPASNPDSSPASAAAAAGATRAAVGELRRLDPDLAVGPVRGLPEVTAVSRTPQRLAAGLATGLGSVALLLAAMGIYGLVAFAVVGRRREVGIRLALGAERRQILAGVLRRELAAVVPALVAGGALALLAGRGLRGLLYGVSPTDPWVLLAAPGLLLAVILAAALLPARRSAATDPAEALRGS